MSAMTSPAWTSMDMPSSTVLPRKDFSIASARRRTRALSKVMMCQSLRREGRDGRESRAAGVGGVRVEACLLQRLPELAGCVVVLDSRVGGFLERGVALGDDRHRRRRVLCVRNMPGRLHFRHRQPCVLVLAQ